MTADSGTALRADALRNRNQILTAARQIFADRGPEVPMEEIARAAAVGTGTLYRRFPDRQALIRAVARDSYAAVLTEVRAAAEESPNGWEALVRSLRSSQELQLSVQLAMLSPLAWQAIREDPRVGRFRHELLAALDGVVRTAQTEGTLREDVGTGDVAALLFLLLRRMPTTSDEDAWKVSERALALMLDGLRPRTGTSLPGRPLTVEHFNSMADPET